MVQAILKIRMVLVRDYNVKPTPPQQQMHDTHECLVDIMIDSQTNSL